MIKLLIYLILIFLSVLIQHTAVSSAFPDIFLNLPLVLVFIFVVLLDYYSAITFSFLTGLVYDFFAVGPFGINIVVFLIIAFIMEAIISRLRKLNAIAILIIGFFAFLSYNFLFFLVNYIFEFFNLDYYQLSADLFLRKEFLISVFINTGLFFLFYIIFKRFR